MKITLEIESLGNGKWGLDMSRVFTDASNMPVNRIYAHGEGLTEAQLLNRIGLAAEKAMAEIDTDWCYLCDRPKDDCACEESEPDPEAHLGDYEDGDGTPDHRWPA